MLFIQEGCKNMASHSSKMVGSTALQNSTLFNHQMAYDTKKQSPRKSENFYVHLYYLALGGCDSVRGTATGYRLHSLELKSLRGFDFL